MLWFVGNILHSREKERHLCEHERHRGGISRSYEQNKKEKDRKNQKDSARLRQVLRVI